MMRKLKRYPKESYVSLFLKTLMAVVIVLIMTPGCSDDDLESISSPVTTTRDAQGVWFIKGPSDAHLFDVFNAMGYAVATDRLWQAELFRRSARGRLAEIFGSDYLETDKLTRMTGYSDTELDQSFDALDSESREIIMGYISGFNRRITEVVNDTSLLPYEFKVLTQQLGHNVIPQLYTHRDILAWTALFQRNFDPEGLSARGQLDNAELIAALEAQYPNDNNGNLYPDYLDMFEDLRWVNDTGALTVIPTPLPSPPTPSSSNSRSFSADNAYRLSSPYSPRYKDISQAAQNIKNALANMKASLSKIGSYTKLGSYAWTISGQKTASGNPILYSGPQMGFSVPSIVFEGSIEAGGLKVSGMTMTLIPGILVGRTPHHAWSAQVGHAHTVDYYLENPDDVVLNRTETIKVFGQPDVTLNIYRSSHGPIVNPIDYNPNTYVSSPTDPIVAWKYSHWGYEFQSAKSLLGMAKAKSMDEFGAAIEGIAVSQHICYADKDGNIAYWMTGRDPVRPAGEYRLPQGAVAGAPILEWDSANLIARSTDRNTSRGYYGGWNNKTNVNYNNAPNNMSYYFGSFHRAQVIEDYLSANNNLTFEQVRDLALNIATTDSFASGGNPWKFVATDFSAAVNTNATQARTDALALMTAWDGHFVDGGQSQWVQGTDRADAWILMDAWIKEALRLTFQDELGTDLYDMQRLSVLFNVFLRGLSDTRSSIVNRYNWYQNLADTSAPQTLNDIIVKALDNTLDQLGSRPWGTGQRGTIEYHHDILDKVAAAFGQPATPVNTMPFASRSTYAQCVEMGSNGPVRIESMFPLGESGTILMNESVSFNPIFDTNFLSMAMDASGAPAYFDVFEYRTFPLFE